MLLAFLVAAASNPALPVVGTGAVAGGGYAGYRGYQSLANSAAQAKIVAFLREPHTAHLAYHGVKEAVEGAHRIYEGHVAAAASVPARANWSLPATERRIKSVFERDGLHPDHATTLAAFMTANKK